MRNACLLFFAIGGDNHNIDEYFRPPGFTRRLAADVTADFAANLV
jgi:hypothetical protein